MLSCIGWGRRGEREPHLHPGLLMQMCDVELPARCMGHQLVMLLQNLVETLWGQHANTTVMKNTKSAHMGQHE